MQPRNNYKLTYIASGNSFTKVTFPECYSDEELKSWVKGSYDKMQLDPYHKFGLLYNAWTEKAFGEKFLTFKDNLDMVEADSGGLQAVTQGHVLTAKDKETVYINQGTYSDYAMCFDEIPLKFTGGKSTRLDLSNRWYEPSMLEPMARETGRNIKNQIETFLRIDSKSKPVFIIQGNCYDSYMKWADFALQEIPQELHQFIGGVAMGAAALGHGTLEDIKRAFFYTQLPEVLKQTNHMHLLAVGSVQRLIPNMIFLQNGVYDNLFLTYDSTTHTSGIQMGRYYLDQRNFDFPQHKDKIIWQKIYDDVERQIPTGMTFDGFYDCFNVPSLKYMEVNGSRNDLIKAYVAVGLSAIKNFISHVEYCLQSRENLLKLSDKKSNYTAFKNLYEVKNLDDFKHWEKHIGRYVTSKPVTSGQPQTLDEFF